ncbi:hypothetical protein ASF24_09685 [Methylobacterium sp. Leaf86]|uniref:DUF7002 family protein n=1 Tax=Methylobacterium sp. Leaf86 TaxID=1736242 RepID=UPI0006FF2AEC|nr:hypothetical protein [Methylobacterium sp. Leaf86]KQO49403.1 hypothetical protein ASF24_09685 [Methylobacterium sp. Leaf86]
MTPDKLVAKYPRLWHMAHDGSWPSIEEHGLRCTSSLLDLYEVDGAARVALERRHRPVSVPIRRPGLPGAVVRDQIPMSDKALTRCLDDELTPADWYAILNARVFFWPTRERLSTLLNADTYRDDPQTVLTIDTKSLVDAYADKLQLSAINSGSTIMNPARRGKLTFAHIGEFPLEEKRKRPRSDPPVAEVVVPDCVSSMRDHVLTVHRMRGDVILEEIWRNPRASAEDGP